MLVDLPIALEGIYCWIAFLPSRTDVRILVANRHFGIFTHGWVSMYGIETRRRVTFSWINRMLPSLIRDVSKHMDALRQQRICFIFTRGDLDVAAWDLLDLPNREIINSQPYRILLQRAVHAVLQREARLENWLPAKGEGGMPIGTISGYPTLGPLCAESAAIGSMRWSL